MSLNSNNLMVLALPFGQEVRIYARETDKATLLPDYTCVSKRPAGAETLIDFTSFRSEQEALVTGSLATLEAVRESGAEQVPFVMEEADPEAGPVSFDLCLARCFAAEFFRYALQTGQDIAADVAAYHAAPDALHPLIRAMEQALKLDRADWVWDVAVAALARLQDPFHLAEAKGNKSYATRLIADLAARMDAPETEITALELSCDIDRNAAKFSRLILLKHQNGHVEDIFSLIERFESCYPLGPRLKALKTRLMQDD